MRHARKMLEEMKLRDLGQFAAHMGFQLVPFFKKEQGRAAKTEEPVKALQAIHRDFEWPYEWIKLFFLKYYKNADIPYTGIQRLDSTTPTEIKK